MSSAKWRPSCLGLNVLKVCQGDKKETQWHEGFGGKSNNIPTDNAVTPIFVAVIFVLCTVLFIFFSAEIVVIEMPAAFSLKIFLSQ